MSRSARETQGCNAGVATGEDDTMTTTTHLQHVRLGVPQHPLRRNVPEATLGGVCAGIACRLGIRTTYVRLATALASLVFGVGLVVYMIMWLAICRDGEDQPIARRLEGQRRTSSVVLWLLAAVLAILILITRLGLALLSPYAWSVLLSLVFLVVIWRGSSANERAHLEDFAQALPVLGVASMRGWRAIAWRLIPAAVLIVVGLQILQQVGGVWGAAVPALIGGAALIVGVLVLLAPWWLQTVRDLSRERRVRVRAEERAALVAHVHDSVLQTLTLIERSAADPAAVRRLARAQERELRTWLFAPDQVGATTPTDETFATQLRSIQHDVERDYGVRIELVVVGDAPIDERISGLLAATREAAINAAKWSGDDHFSIYGEVEPAAISVYVRDTGVGFDPATVPDDRQGLALSIRARVEQIGGSSSVRTKVGAGTDVALTITREVAE